MSSVFAVEPRSPSALAAPAAEPPDGTARRRVDIKPDGLEGPGGPANHPQAPAPMPPADGVDKPLPYNRSLLGKARAYHEACLKRRVYRWHFGMMLVGSVGDGIMLGASNRILGLLRFAPAARAGWGAFVWNTGEKLVGQTTELGNANLRDNARAARAQRDGQPTFPLAFRNLQARLFTRTNLGDMACCGAWIGIAACTLALGATVWPVVLASTAVALAMAWNRSGRSVAWENVRFNLEVPAEQPSTSQLTMRYGSTIGMFERILCTAAQALGLGLALAVELGVAPACVGATAAVGVVIGTLAVGCAVGSAAKWAQACWASQLPVPTQ